MSPGFWATIWTIWSKRQALGRFIRGFEVSEEQRGRRAEALVAGEEMDALEAVREERYLVGWHADEQCEERGVAPWQLAAMLDAARLVRERPASKPHPSVVGEQSLADGTGVQAVWSLMRPSGRAKLVTVYFRRNTP